MFKDARGFLWVGGESFNSELCRFDGAVFKKYLPGQKRGAISSDDVYTFKEDSLHNIWMGTGKGISRYDMKADTFTNFSPFIDSLFPTLIIAPFWATKDEMYCMEPGGAITAINIHTLKRKKILQLSKTQYPELSELWNANKSFFDKSSKSFWFLRLMRKVAAGWNKFSRMEGSNSIHGLVMKVKPAMGIMGMMPKTCVMIPVEIRFGSTAEKDCLNFL
jgi:hypothetical protein